MIRASLPDLACLLWEMFDLLHGLKKPATLLAAETSTHTCCSSMQLLSVSNDRLWHAGMPLDLCGIQELAALTDLQLLSLAQSRLLTSQIHPLSQLTSLTHLDISRSKVEIWLLSLGTPNTHKSRDNWISKRGQA